MQGNPRRLAHERGTPQNRGMRTFRSILFMIAAMTAASDAFAQQDVLYRCETAEGISIQDVPCPKGAIQRKIAVQRTSVPATPVATAPAAAVAAPGSAAPPAPMPATPKTVSPIAPAAAVASLAPPPAPRPGTHWVLVTDDALLHGPNAPYPLWQCMRADGSTYDSRDGVAGKQWVPTPKPEESEAAAPVTPKSATMPKAPIVRHMGLTTSIADDTPKQDLGPPPPGAAPGQWVADECTKLDPQQACARYAARRDALRKQIYASAPSERASYAPEEQDLTSMLYTACGGM
jgi:hypothetical protein